MVFVAGPEGASAELPVELEELEFDEQAVRSAAMVAPAISRDGFLKMSAPSKSIRTGVRGT